MPHKSPLYLVVSHDAGGAEIISAYVKKNPDHFRFVVIVQGPAEKIFRRKKLVHLFLDKHFETSADVFASLDKVDGILAGSSWSSSLEKDFVVEGKKKNIPTIVYFDHWVHYRERFGYPRENWQQNQPDEVWVGDGYALEMAQRELTVPVKVVPNLYFQEIQDEYEQFIQNNKNLYPWKNAVLFVSEPLSAAINTEGDTDNYSFTEYDVLEQFLRVCLEKNIQRPILVRFHPSERKDKYDTLLGKYSNLKIEKSRGGNIFEDFLCSEFVVGMESMALVLAIMCQKRVISYLPDYEAHCPLPLQEIHRTHSPEELVAVFEA